MQKDVELKEGAGWFGKWGWDWAWGKGGLGIIISPLRKLVGQFTQGQRRKILE